MGQEETDMEKRLAQAALTEATIHRVEAAARSLATEKGISIEIARGIARLAIARAMRACGLDAEASAWLSGSSEAELEGALRAAI